MSLLEVFSEKDIKQFTKHESGDTKLGETMQVIENADEWQTELADSFAQFVVVNIGEDVGTKTTGFLMNTKNVFENVLRQFANFQDNLYLHGGDLLLLGRIKTSDIEERLKFLSVTKDQLYEAVEQIDERVHEVAKLIFDSGKIPIFVGGGQNNTYPILKALSESQDSPANCLNIAAHSSLRPPEGRHARNGLSYALLDGFLDRYYVFGLHESEIPQTIYEFILANYDQIGFTRFEAILKNDPYMFEAIQEANEFVEGQGFGLDINLNSVSDLLLSPEFPDGFLLREIRQLIRKICMFHQPKYLHLCEARAGEKGSIEAKIVGKSMALLVADFIKSYNYSTEEEEE